MRRACRGLALGGILVAVATISPAQAETVEFPVYYPSPAATTAEPPKPQIVYVAVANPLSSELMDVYAALKLWRFGVTRSQLSIVRWRPSDWNGFGWTETEPGAGPPGSGWLLPSATMASSSNTKTLTQFYPAGTTGKATVWRPSMEQGMIYTAKEIHPNDRSVMLEVEVTW